MKRILSLTLVGVLVICLAAMSLPSGTGGAFSASALESARPTPVDLTSRDDFGWGINIHSPQYNAYPEIYLEEQINKVARMGSKWIRLNGYNKEGDYTYLDTAVGLANKYGLKIIMTLSPETNLGLDYITLVCKTMATRYNGENGRGYVDIFQIWNETDIKLLQAKYGVGGGAAGTTTSHYYTISVEDAADLPEYLEYFTAARQGIDEAGGKSKFMINFAATHWGCIKYYLDKGLKIDVIGWDHYVNKPYNLEASAIEMTEDCDGFYNDVIKEYNIPVILAETNIHMGMLNQADRVNPTLETYDSFLDLLYITYTRPWIKGAVLYELLNELAFGETNQESYFGMFYCEMGGLIGEPKPIYTKMQELLKADKNLPVIKRESVDLTPYKALVVDTADDSGLGGGTTDADIDVTPVTDDYGSDDYILPDDTDDLEDDGNIIENIIRPIKKIKVKELVKIIPWALEIGVIAVLVIIPVAYIVIYLLIKKKKLKK